MLGDWPRMTSLPPSKDGSKVAGRRHCPRVTTCYEISLASVSDCVTNYFEPRSRSETIPRKKNAAAKKKSAREKKSCPRKKIVTAAAKMTAAAAQIAVVFGQSPCRLDMRRPGDKVFCRRASKRRLFCYDFQRHAARAMIGGFNPAAATAAGLRSIPAPLRMLRFRGIVSLSSQTTVCPLMRTSTRRPRAAVPSPSHSSRGRAHMGRGASVASPHRPTQLSPTLKHSISLRPFALQRRNAALSAASAKLDALTSLHSFFMAQVRRSSAGANHSPFVPRAAVDHAGNEKVCPTPGSAAQQSSVMSADP